MLPLLAGVLLLYNNRERLLGPEWDTAVRLAAAVVLLALSWHFARDVGRAVGPWLFQRMEPHTAGTVGFLIRLTTMVLAVVMALRIAGLDAAHVAVGGGDRRRRRTGCRRVRERDGRTVLLSARRPVGERIRLQGGGSAGSVEGVVASLGILMSSSHDGPVMVPNAVVLSVAVVPLTEPNDVSAGAAAPPTSPPRTWSACCVSGSARRCEARPASRSRRPTGSRSSSGSPRRRRSMPRPAFASEVYGGDFPADQPLRAPTPTPPSGRDVPRSLSFSEHGRIDRPHEVDLPSAGSPASRSAPTGAGCSLSR